MAVFVDLDDEPESPDTQNSHHHGVTPEWNGNLVRQMPAANGSKVGGPGSNNGADSGGNTEQQWATAHVRENPNKNAMTEAFGAYPIVTAIASSLDLNTLDNLSRTCRQVREGLLQYRSSLVTQTLHCVNEDVALDPEDTFRYRARASNWFYMEDSRSDYNGKSGHCARDLVAECRRCARVVCRNCAIKPPAPIVLRDRHRRLCKPCMKAPLGRLAKPPLLDSTPIESEIMKQTLCTCQTDGVWLCQPCGRSIRGADHDYHSLWKWRNQYGEVLGGLGTGIGDGDRGVICGRDTECIAAREIEQETDCDAEDARDLQNGTPPPIWVSSSPAGSPDSRRTPSPQLGPGYARHEIEGIGGVVKKKRLTMVKVGACVPEWEDEKNKGDIMGREVSGRVRSWCGWCWRVIPGKKDRENGGSFSADSP